MKVSYDPEVGVLRIVLGTAPIDESDESKPGVMLDYDQSGHVVGIEVLDASKCVEKSAVRRRHVERAGVRLN